MDSGIIKVEETLPTLQDKEIRQHNLITNARYEMTACEQDTFFYLLSLLRKDDLSGTKYKVRVKDLEKRAGREYNYQQFKAATEALGSRMYEVLEDGEYVQLWILSKAKYKKKEGCIELSISDDIRPYLIDLKNRFTSYSLASALSLSSKYAKRVYQLMSQWKDVGVKVYELDELKYMFKLKDPKGKEPEQYEKFSAFKRYVLDVAKDQINEKTDLKIDFEPVKKGRSFTAIRFYINAQKPKQLPINFELDDLDPKQEKALELLKSLGIKKGELIRKILTDHVNDLFSWEYKRKTGVFKAEKNPGGHFLKSIGLV